MRKMTHTRMLEKAQRGLRVQKGRCILDFMCQYALGHRHCAIGWGLVGMIPKASPVWKAQSSLLGLRRTYEVVERKIGHLDLDFLGELQQWHDAKTLMAQDNYIIPDHLWKMAKHLDYKLRVDGII